MKEPTKIAIYIDIAITRVKSESINSPPEPSFHATTTCDVKISGRKAIMRTSNANPFTKDAEEFASGRGSFVLSSPVVSEADDSSNPLRD